MAKKMNTAKTNAGMITNIIRSARPGSQAFTRYPFPKRSPANDNRTGVRFRDDLPEGLSFLFRGIRRGHILPSGAAKGVVGA